LLNKLYWELDLFLLDLFFYFTFYLFGGVRPDLPRDCLINQSSDTAYSDVGYVLTDEAITQRDTLLLLTYVI